MYKNLLLKYDTKQLDLKPDLIFTADIRWRSTITFWKENLKNVTSATGLSRNSI